jgi:3-isopropylmalate/(R)-2-methylmalate dehydratase small subunit
VSEARISTITGRAVPLRGDDIDTDRIIPARFLRAVTFDGLERHLFEDDRRSGPHAFNEARYQGASVLIVNRNFGCGSSREHAPQAIHRWGIRAIVGESFSEIFFGNALALGLPCVQVSRPDAAALMAAVEADHSVEFRVDLEGETVTAGSSPPVRTVQAQAAREAFLTGAWDATGLLRAALAEVEATAARLPYLVEFRGRSTPLGDSTLTPGEGH